MDCGDTALPQEVNRLGDIFGGGSQPQPPVYIQPPPDPALVQQTAQAAEQNQQAIQTQVQSDSARIMALYGANSAIAGNPISLSAPSGNPTTPGVGLNSLTALIAAGAKG